MHLEVMMTLVSASLMVSFVIPSKDDDVGFGFSEGVMCNPQ